MASLQGLPTEILLEIVEYLDSISDLRSLSATSRRFHYVSNPVLYSLAAKKCPNLLCWACGAGLLGVVEKLLVAGSSPNLPAVIPTYYETPTFYRYSCPSKNTTSDSIYALVRFYGHGYEGYHPFQADVYDSSLHSDVEEYSIPDTKYWFPLHAASTSGSIEIVRLLVDFGACLDPPSRGLCHCTPDGRGDRSHEPPHIYWTPLHTALCCGNENIANLLLAFGASSNVELRHRQSSALHWAARGSRLSTARLLLEGGCNTPVDVQDLDGATPLMWALGTERSEQMMEYLLQHGANINAQLTSTEHQKPTALMQACYNGWYKDAIFLVNAGAMIHPVSRIWPSALDECFSLSGAAQLLDMSMRRCIWLDRYMECDLKLGQLTEQPCPNDANEDVNFADMVELVKKLIHSGANIHGSRAAVQPPLICASAACSVPLVELLLASGSNVNQEDDLGFFPLLAVVDNIGVHWADGSVFHTVECLLKHGANPNKTNKFGQTALMEVCCKFGRSTNQLEMVKLLVNYGADKNLRAPYRRDCGFPRREYWRKHSCSPLQVAFYQRKYDICRYLMEQGAEVSHKKADLRFMLQDCLCHFRKEEEENERTEMDELLDGSNVYPSSSRVNLCAPLRALLGIDRSGWLAKDPQSLWLSTKVSAFPLTKAFLDAGATDASWTVKHWGSCLNYIARWGFRENPDIDCIQRLISLGADVNGVEQSYSVLHSLLTYANPISGFADNGVAKYVEFFTLLVDNGAALEEDELVHFEDKIRLDTIHNMALMCSVWELREQEGEDFVNEYEFYGADYDEFHLNLRRELRRRFVVENNKIVRRKQLTYGDVALPGGEYRRCCELLS
ncbi:ankyrin [Hypoxylon sp. FL0890]|nr:ankyrin [Hypoxylon sp. FL0890]